MKRAGVLTYYSTHEGYLRSQLWIGLPAPSKKLPKLICSRITYRKECGRSLGEFVSGSNSGCHHPFYMFVIDNEHKGRQGRAENKQGHFSPGKPANGTSPVNAS